MSAGEKAGQEQDKGEWRGPSGTVIGAGEREGAGTGEGEWGNTRGGGWRQRLQTQWREAEGRSKEQAVQVLAPTPGSYYDYPPAPAPGTRGCHQPALQ